MKKKVLLAGKTCHSRKSLYHHGVKQEELVALATEKN
jgi:hypothetical protein